MHKFGVQSISRIINLLLKLRSVIFKQAQHILICLLKCSHDQTIDDFLLNEWVTAGGPPKSLRSEVLTSFRPRQWS